MSMRCLLERIIADIMKGWSGYEDVGESDGRWVLDVCFEVVVSRKLEDSCNRYE